MTIEQAKDDLLDEIVDDKDIPIVRRLMFRTLLMALLSLLGFAFLAALAYVGREKISNINQQVPELMIIVRAASIMVWVELALLWTRIIVAPQLDVQAAAKAALANAQASALVYAVSSLVWLARIIIFLRLCEFP